jgi:hypothetical protein
MAELMQKACFVCVCVRACVRVCVRLMSDGYSLNVSIEATAK